MVGATLQKRLVRLEESRKVVRRQRGVDDAQLRNVVITLIAFHLGGLTENEAIMDGFARGTEYERQAAMIAGLKAGSGTAARDDLNERYQSAFQRLVALTGLDLQDDTCSSVAIADAIRAMFYAMPISLQRHPFLKGFEPDPPRHSTGLSSDEGRSEHELVAEYDELLAR